MAYHIKGVFRSVCWHFLFCLSAFVTVLSWWPSVCGKCCLRCMRFLSFSATLLNWAARTVPQDCPSSRTICCAHDLLCRDKWHQRPVVQSAKENDGTTSFLASEMWREYHIKFFLNSKHGALTLPWIMMKAFFFPPNRVNDQLNSKKLKFRVKFNMTLRKLVLLNMLVHH